MPRGISRYDEAALQGRLWTPKDSGVSMALWLDASDLSTISCGTSGVSEWRDKSGNNRHLTQATSANQPVYTALGLNNKNIITFGTDDYFGSLNIPNTFNILTLYFVGNPSAINQYHNFIDRPSGNLDLPMIWIDTNNRWEINTATGLVITSALIGTPHIAGFKLQTTNPTISFWGNGGLAITSNSSLPGWPNPTTFTFFNRANSQTYQGTCAEIIWVDGNVSENDRLKIEGYLAWKWGLEAKLRAEHPFVLRPPTIGD